VACDFPETLTQSTSQTITQFTSIACLLGSTYHHDNSYWRAFTLSQSLNVTSVEIGIEQATATSGSQPLTVNIYENTGGVFPSGTRTLRGTASVSVSNQSLTKLNIPITASLPKNAQMVVEVFTPSGVASGNVFFMGSNSSGQSGSSYLSAANCNLSAPVTFTSIGFSNVHLVMNVIGCKGPDIYVRWNAGGANNGTSWSNAYTSFQDALDNANAGNEIWVAKGTYKPTKDHNGSTSPTDPRDKNFHLSKDLKIYGGFNGFETLFSDRDIKVHETILSGDFTGNDEVSGTGSTLDIANNGENAYHVLILANLTSASVIDGFTIKGGNADGIQDVTNKITYATRSYARYIGGGVNTLYSDARFSNNTFRGNKARLGAGMYGGYSSIKIENSYFKWNLALIDGGGLLFSALYTTATPLIANTIFSGNRAVQSGGAIYNSGNSTIVNSTFNGNSSLSGSAIINWNNTTTPLTISNSIFWKNANVNGYSNPGDDIRPVNDALTVVSHCMTQSFNTGTNLIVGQDPWFKDASIGDFRINPCSPAINTGNNNAWNALSLTTDFGGNPRPFDGTVDIGAFESQFSPFLTATAIYVKWNATGNNDGTSWANAYTNLQDALDNQCGNLDIWVASGTYKPTTDHLDSSTPPSEQSKTFHFSKDMKIYGGFAGTETQLSQRNWLANATILSGDFAGNDVVFEGGNTLSITNNGENAFHVLITANLTNAAVIDGFTIQGGNAIGYNIFLYASKYYDLANGGGMLNAGSSLSLSHLIFTGNAARKFGGGMSNETSSPILNSVLFTKNLTAEVGGGLFNNLSNPVISNTLFSLNKADYGGGIYNYNSSSPVITNVTLVSNAAVSEAGAIFNQLDSYPNILNSIFWDNTKAGLANVAGADISNNGSSPTITYSLTQANSYYPTGVGMINNKNPQFTDAANGVFTLQKCSPAINKGTNTGAPSTDFTGNARPFSGTLVDMGAYEYSFSILTKSYVKANAAGSNDGSSWLNAYTDLNPVLKSSCYGDTIWTAAGTYKPTATTDRTISFEIPDGVKLYGGFAGTEAVNYNLNLRDFETYETILSGDIGVSDDSTDNSHHIVFTKNVSSETLLDGFKITKGNAVGGSYGASGGGWINDGSGSGNSSAPELKNIIFYKNTAGFGGVMGNNGNNGGSASPKMSNCTISSNTALGDGGAIYNYSDGGESSPTFINCSFSSNIASNDGGAIYNDGRYQGVSSPIITNCSFNSNIALDDGGAIYNDGKFQSASSPIITNCSFKANIAADKGGVIYNDGEEGESTPTFTYCGFNSNSAKRGGAIYNEGTNGESNPTIINSSFRSNTATERGGAIYWLGDGGDISSKLSNCTFISNGTEHFYYDDGVANKQARFINCSFFGATTRVVRTFFDSDLTPIDFTNCIFWGNNGDIVDKRVDDPFAGDVNTRVNIVNSIVEELAFAGSNNNINQDPQFVDAANGFLQLKCNSPAINAGTATGAPTDDITGFTRVGLPDMGAYEYGQAVVDIQLPNGTNPSLSGIPILKANSQILNTNNVLYQGSNNVQLLPGFSVNPMSGAATVFRAEIGGGCL
jgi:predicted outer membrane repeat protein